MEGINPQSDRVVDRVADGVADGVADHTEAVEAVARPRIGVVLAAGRSRRLARVTGGTSKALVRVGGLPLVQVAVRTLLDLGLDEVIVVVGYKGDRVAEAARSVAPGRVTTVAAERWRDGNGASLSAVEPLVDREELFAVVTMDHVFGDGALTTLLVARRPTALIDPEPDAATWAEGTRVALRGDLAIAFSKELDAAAVDCGAFVVSPAVFAAYRRAAAEGDHTLAGALSALASQQPVATVPLPAGVWWHDVDTPADLRAVRRKLRRDLTKPTDGPVSRFLNRPISTRLSMAIAPSGVPPDLISWIGFALGAASAWLLAAGVGWWAALAVHVTSVVDGMDGEVARLQRRARPAGALLDGVLDRVADVAIMGGLGVWAVARQTITPRGGVVLTAAAVGAAILSMATKDRVAALQLRPAPERQIGFLLGGRDGRLLIIAIGALLGRPVWALVAATVTATASLVARLILVRARS